MMNPELIQDIHKQMEMMNGNYCTFPMMLYMIEDLYMLELKEDELQKEYVVAKQHQIVLQPREYLFMKKKEVVAVYGHIY